MFNFKIIFSLIATALIVNLAIKFKFPHVAEEEPETEERIEKKGPVKKTSRRMPASTRSTQKEVTSLIAKTEVDRSEKEEAIFNEPVSGQAVSQSPKIISSGGSNFASRNGSNTNDLSRKTIDNKVEQPKSKNSPITEINTTKPDDHFYANDKDKNKKDLEAKKEDPVPVKHETSAPEETAQTNKCSPSIIAGSFNHPIGVNLSCTNQSLIKYCVGIDTGAGCCNPEMTSKTFSSQIIIGPKDGNYCLSFYGDSATGKSEVSQVYYTINAALPNLSVATPTVFFQTTKAPNKTLFSSTDFGKAGFGIGQINLKTHDPSALGYSCDDIMANYVELTSPVPQTILAILDVSSDNPLNQITIPLRPNFLDYGENFVTSYIENNNYVAPMYACSTTKVTLFDFEYFDFQVSNGTDVTNSVQELSWGFSPYGFFETEATLDRSPAGVYSDPQSGQELQMGQFAVFYEN